MSEKQAYLQDKENKYYQHFLHTAASSDRSVKAPVNIKVSVHSINGLSPATIPLTRLVSGALSSLVSNTLTRLLSDTVTS